MKAYFFSVGLRTETRNLYSTYTERRSSSETAIEFALLSFYRSDPTYKSEPIKLLDVIAVCNQLHVNALIRYREQFSLGGDLTDCILLNFLLQAISAFRATHYNNIFLTFL